jgi:phosphohistidine phosphatase SixA
LPGIHEQLPPDEHILFMRAIAVQRQKQAIAAPQPLCKHANSFIGLQKDGLMKTIITDPPELALIPKMTTVYIVRHADKGGGASDPPLSPTGLERAQTLAYMLRQDKVKAVFVTSFLRSRQTGEPAALDSGVALQEYSDPKDVADLILANFEGRRVLVVAHSNTVKVIAARLTGSIGVAIADIQEHQYDRFYVVHRNGPKGHLDRLRYGVATP